MNQRHHLKQLGRLVDLREREVDRLSADMADKQAVRQRYLGNLARLEQLCKGSGPSSQQMGSQQTGSQQKGGQQKDAQQMDRPATLSPALSLNCGGYKQAVMQLADVHRVDLSLHEAAMLTTQRLMAHAVRRHESLDLVLERQRESVRRSQNARDQKGQDDLAAQVWLRGRK